MRIKIFIVTYNNNDVLNNWCLKTLLNSDIKNYNHQIFIINNHSNIHIEPQYKSQVTLLNNVLRPDWSCGHLSRNWNQALMHGFKNLKQPDSDIVVCVQNDEKFQKDWTKHLIKYHKKYSFISFGAGDSFLSFTPESVQKIGIFDERFFCGKHEHDYFLRALMYNRDKSSINDITHGYMWNLLPNKILIPTLCGNDGKRESQAKKIYQAYRPYTHYCRTVFEKKWGFYDWAGKYLQPSQKDPKLKAKVAEWLPKNTQIPNFVYYPYFEEGVENLKEKNYVV